jgi:hypothetical protein
VRGGRGWWLGATALLVAGISAAACGVPIDRGPTALARSGVPFGLLDPSTVPTTTTTPSPTPVTVSVQIFLINPTGQLVAVQRNVAVPAPLATLLAALADGPTNAEAAGGLESAVPPQTQVVSASIAGGLATVDLAGTIGQLVGQSEINAVAQIVFTATGLPSVTGVSFYFNGQPVSVPTATGAEVPIATRAQFASMAPTPIAGATAS